MISLSCPKGGFEMEEWLKGLPPEEQLKQALTELAKSFIGCQLNGIDSSISCGGVRQGEVRVSFVYGVKQPDDRRGEIIFGIREEDLVSLEHQPRAEESLIIPFSGEGAVQSDTDIIGPLNGLIAGRKVAGIDFERIGEEVCRICLWLSDETIIYLNTKRGPAGLPRGRAMVRQDGVLRGGELPFSKDSGYYLTPSATASAG
jgi:hypothetical protein